MTEVVSVITIDPDPLYRQGLAQLLSERPHLCLIGEVGHGSGALDAISRLSPDVVVLDPAMPGLDEVRLLDALRRQRLRTRVLLLASELCATDADRALAAGASGCLSKGAIGDEVAHAIGRVARGEVVVAPQLIEPLAGRAGLARAAEERCDSRRRRFGDLLALLVAARALSAVDPEIAYVALPVVLHVLRSLGPRRPSL